MNIYSMKQERLDIYPFILNNFLQQIMKIIKFISLWGFIGFGLQVSFKFLIN